MEIRTKLAKDKYAFNKNSETHLLVELSAPKVEINEKRAPICLVPVLDVSGSMAGDKIDYVRKACRKMIDHLNVGDYAGIVAFDSQVYDIARISQITQEKKEDMKVAVGKLRAGSCTNMSGGLARALEWINAMDLPKNTIMRVILFTDGHANIGVAGRDLLDFTTELKQRATISAFGFGGDCDQELLADISSKCGANYAFIDSPDSAMSAFGTELGGLMTTYAQNIEIMISPDKNNQVVEILNDEDVVEENGEVRVEIRDILGEEKKWVVAKVQLSEVSKVLPRSVSAFSVLVNYLDKNGKKQTEEVLVKTQFCKPCEESEDDLEVVKHRDRLLAARAQTQAEQYARVGNYKMAQMAMDACYASISDVDTKDLLGSLSASYSSSATYTANSGTTNSVRSLLRNRRISHIGEGTKKFAQSAGRQNYSVVNNFVDSFTGDEDNQNTITTTTPDEDSHTVDKKRSKSDW